jgi:hypothetical protein
VEPQGIGMLSQPILIASHSIPGVTVNLYRYVTHCCDRALLSDNVQSVIIQRRSMGGHHLPWGLIVIIVINKHTHKRLCEMEGPSLFLIAFPSLLSRSIYIPPWSGCILLPSVYCAPHCATCCLLPDSLLTRFTIPSHATILPCDTLTCRCACRPIVASRWSYNRRQKRRQP